VADRPDARQARMVSGAPASLAWIDCGDDHDPRWRCEARCTACGVASRNMTYLGYPLLSGYDDELDAIDDLIEAGCPHTDLLLTIVALLQLEDPPSL
jgi:hypothetical protein